jgi:uncharacterized protein
MFFSEQEKKELLKISRQTLTEYLTHFVEPQFETSSENLLKHYSCFVTLNEKKTNELRGCRGETSADRPLIKSVVKMSIASAVDDPRFFPMVLDEVAEIKIKLNVLSEMRKILVKDVVVGKHGLLIKKGYNAGLLLPQVPVHYNWNREMYLQQLCKKAGLPKDSWQSPDIILFGFETIEWGE